MKKIICDLCLRKDVEKESQFRIQRNSIIGHYGKEEKKIPYFEWEEVDLCNDCIEEIVSIIKRKNQNT